MQSLLATVEFLTGLVNVVDMANRHLFRSVLTKSLYMVHVPRVMPSTVSPLVVAAQVFRSFDHAGPWPYASQPRLGESYF